MASRRGEDDVNKLAAELGQTLKEGERILAPTRRPDGTLPKPIRIRAGYVPQDEVAIYQSKGSLWKKEMETLEEFPPGCDPVLDGKPKTKSAKRNERKKEKRLQAALDKNKNSDTNGVSSVEDVNQLLPVEAITSELNSLKFTSPDAVPDIDRKIRALKKKIRLTEEAQKQKSALELKPEQLEKLAKLEDWRNELKLLEDKKTELTAL